MSQTIEILEFIQKLVLKIHHLEAERDAANDTVEIVSEANREYQRLYQEVLEQQTFEREQLNELLTFNTKLERKIRSQKKTIEATKNRSKMWATMADDFSAKIEGFRTILKRHEIQIPGWLL